MLVPGMGWAIDAMCKPERGSMAPPTVPVTTLVRSLNPKP